METATLVMDHHPPPTPPGQPAAGMTPHDRYHPRAAGISGTGGLPPHGAWPDDGRPSGADAVSLEEHAQPHRDPGGGGQLRTRPRRRGQRRRSDPIGPHVTIYLYAVAGTDLRLAYRVFLAADEPRLPHLLHDLVPRRRRPARRRSATCATRSARRSRTACAPRTPISGWRCPAWTPQPRTWPEACSRTPIRSCTSPAAATSGSSMTRCMVIDRFARDQFGRVTVHANHRPGSRPVPSRYPVTVVADLGCPAAANHRRPGRAHLPARAAPHRCGQRCRLVPGRRSPCPVTVGRWPDSELRARAGRPPRASDRDGGRPTSGSRPPPTRLTAVAPFLGFMLNNLNDPERGRPLSDAQQGTRVSRRGRPSPICSACRPMTGGATSRAGATEGNEHGLHLARQRYPTGLVYVSAAAHPTIGAIVDRLRHGPYRRTGAGVGRGRLRRPGR